MSRTQRRSGTKSAIRECPICHNKPRRYWRFHVHVNHCQQKQTRRALRVIDAIAKEMEGKHA